MNKIVKFYIIFIIILVAVLSYHGCSELEKNLVVAPTIGAHPAGWVDENSPNFHGKYIYNNKLWNLVQCRSCHGADYKGGSTGKSCLTCHSSDEGPQDCGTCHGSSDEEPWPPKALNGDSLETDRGVGVHNHHLSPDSLERYSRQVECSECHVTFGENFDDPNHIGTNPDGIAEITFGVLATNVLPGDTITPNPSWDRNTGKCSNVYCHGFFKMGNRNAQPVFNNPNTVVCGSCHGDPNTGNPNPGVFTNISPHFSYWTINDCYLCHNQVMTMQGVVYNKSKHLNGEINLNQGDKP